MKILFSRYLSKKHLYTRLFTLASRLDRKRSKVTEGEGDRRQAAAMKVSERSDMFMSVALIAATTRNGAVEPLL